MRWLAFTLLLPFLLRAEPAHAQFTAFLSTSHEEVTTLAGPHTDWAVTPYEGVAEDDWYVGAAAEVGVYLRLGEGVTFNGMDVTLMWDASVIALKRVERGESVFENDAFVVYNQLSNPGNVRINAAFTTNQNYTSGAGDFAVRLVFTLLKPAATEVEISHLDLRAVDGAGGQWALDTSPGPALPLRALVGDVATPLTTIEGDGVVDFEDLVIWRESYFAGTELLGGDMATYKAKNDIGPTPSHFIDTLPQSDGRIDFEDLIIFASAYGNSLAGTYPAAVPETTAPVTLQLTAPYEENGAVVVPVHASDLTGLRGASLQFELKTPAFKLVAVRAGDLSPTTSATFVAYSSFVDTPSRFQADIAVLGNRANPAGQGTLLELILQPLVASPGKPGVHLESVELRSTINTSIPVQIVTFLEIEARDLPTEVDLLPIYPNPSSGQTRIRYQLPRDLHVRLEVFDLNGRLVAHLVDRVEPGGQHEILWEDPVSAGAYFVRLWTEEAARSQVLVLK